MGGAGPRVSWGWCPPTEERSLVQGSLAAGPWESWVECLCHSVGYILGPLVEDHAQGRLWAQGVLRQPAWEPTSPHSHQPSPLIYTHTHTHNDPYEVCAALHYPCPAPGGAEHPSNFYPLGDAPEGEVHQRWGRCFVSLGGRGHKEAFQHFSTFLPHEGILSINSLKIFNTEFLWLPTFPL